MSDYPNLQRWLNASARSDNGLAFVLALVGLTIGSFWLLHYLKLDKYLPLWRALILVLFFTTLGVLAIG